MSVTKLDERDASRVSAMRMSDAVKTHGVSGKRRVRRAVATVALGGALMAGTAGVAAAAQSRDLGPNQGRSFATWFWGRTEVCVKNLSNVNGSYYWVSGTSNGAKGLAPGQEICEARSFAGIRIYIQNTSPDAALHVRFPIGP